MLPALGWLRRYDRRLLAADVIAGVVTAILLVPQGVAFALLAGLPPQAGLYASVVGPLVYGFFGTSRTLSVGPVSVAAVMIASALSMPGLTGDYVLNAMVLAAECAVVFFVLAALRLGWLVRLLSHPVLSGFTAGAAVLIIFSQIPQLAGYTGPRHIHGWHIYLEIIEGLPRTMPTTLATALCAVAGLLLLGKPYASWLARQPLPELARTALAKSAPLLIVVAASLGVMAAGLGNLVPLVGTIPGGLPMPVTAFFASPDWVRLFPSAVVIALVGYVESMAIAKALASRRR